MIGADWQRTKVQASDCPRITPEELEKQRRSLGDMFYRQEFNCEFVAQENAVFSYDLFKASFNPDIKSYFERGGR